MVELTYDKDLEQAANDHVTAAVCPSAAKAGPGGENFWSTKKFETPHVEGFKMLRSIEENELRRPWDNER
ncbi:hypothetical protein Y032_0003g1386 [Ancylostoma ceylanicum]|uniref:SCP domain-containing protein n=1 Tax=Ancylostoma ceylanicum TaxID=53326 RepID=A0A016VXG3_9BILA|nr:hypothetical protein Y032_0003g1386 [Ancylostoma ceylanicum]